MNRCAFYKTLSCFVLAAAAGEQAAAQTSALPGDWACYGLEEDATTLYFVDSEILLAADGTWTSEGMFGETSLNDSGLPFEWDYSAAGSWEVEGDVFAASADRLSFMPTRGGAEYEAADPRDYAQLPEDGSWRMEMPEPEFFTLKNDSGSLLIECQKQRIYYEE